MNPHYRIFLDSRYLAILLSCFCTVLGAQTLNPDANRRLCNLNANKPSVDSRISLAVEVAREQHRLFGGQTISPDGGLTKVGFHEAEFDHNPKDGKTATWERVAEFWRELGSNLPGTFRGPDGTRFSRANIKALVEAHVNSNGLEEPRQLKADHANAISAATLRAALVDHPWSAAFISYAQKKAGLSQEEFTFSEAHVDYVQSAFIATASELNGGVSRSAYRACDIVSTKPRSGDLICYTRESGSSLTTHAQLASFLFGRKNEALPMHCDLVVSADFNGSAKLEAIGGNVFQSVTLRKMYLTDDKLLSPIYFAKPEKVACDTDSCEGKLKMRFFPLKRIG
jgi:hypothetical protein